MSNSKDKKEAVDKTVITNPDAGYPAEQNAQTLQMSRRRFMRNLGASAAAVTLTACGGSGKVPVPSPTPAPAPAPANPPPVWSAIPPITFTEGVAATISIAGYVTDNNALTISKNAAALPPGVRFDAASKSFIYDGIGRASVTEGHVLTAVEV
jgi:hypothetical protein